MLGDLNMLRKLWLSSLFLALSGTTIGLGFSETNSVTEVQKPKEKLLTLSEHGKSPIKCKLILAWTSKNGEQCFLVEALDSGKKITIVQNAANSKEKNTTTNYHWVNNDVPPAGSPIPPDQGLTKTPVTPKESKVVEARTAVNSSSVTPTQTAIQKNNKPLKIETATIKKEVEQSTEKKSATEFITIPEPGADKVVVVPEKNKKLITFQKVNPNSDKIVILKEEKVLVTTNSGPEKVISVKEIQKNAPALSTPKEKNIEPKPISPKIASDNIKTENNTTSISNQSPPLEQPKALDWRKSWGRIENTQDKNITTKNQPIDVELPHADKTKPDPLKSVDFMNPKLEEKIAKKAVKAVGNDTANKEINAIVSKASPTKTTAELAENSNPRIPPKELAKAPAEITSKTTPVVKNKTVPKTTNKATEKTLETSNPILIIKEPRQPRANILKVNSSETSKTNDFAERTMGRVYGIFARRPSEKPTTDNIPPGNGSVIAAGAEPVRIVQYLNNGQPTGPAPTASMYAPPQAPQLYPSIPSMRAQVPAYPTQGMSNAFTPVPNQRPIPSDIETTIAMQNAFNQPLANINGIQNQGVNTYANQNTIQQYAPLDQTPPGTIVVIPGQQNIAQVDTILVENIAVLKNANQPSQRENAADQLSKIRGPNMNQAAQALATALKEDPAPLVRAACIRSLSRMKINSIEVLEVISEKKSDLDPRVRMEADQALIQLTSGVIDSGNRIHQAGSTFKR